MKGRAEIAVDYFEKGFTCTQAVLVSFADVLKINKKELLRISSGFGGGMGKLQKTCGAISGAVMVISAIYGYSEKKDIAKKKAVYDEVREFTNRFMQSQNHTNCIDLLACDLNTAAGIAEFKEKNMEKTVCTELVADSVKILEQMMRGKI